MHDLRRVRIVATAITFAVAFGVYLKTLAPSVGLTDSGELTVAAWSLGNAHPPGFPLYLMLTHLFTMLPAGSIAWRVNLASAFFAALAAAAMALAAGEVARRRDDDDPLRTGAVMLFAGLSFAFSRTLWGYATVAEVYALHAFLMATVFALMLAWRPTHRNGFLYAAALTFGLGLGVHHVTIGLCIAGIAALVWLTAGTAFFRSRQLAVCAALAVAALLVYVYLPLAASHHPPLNWGDPSTLGRVIDHITGKQYRGYIAAAGGQAPFDYLGRELGPPWLPLTLLLAAGGLVVLFRRDRPLFWFLVLIAAADLAWFAFYPIANDRDAYLLPTFAAIILAASAAVASLDRRLALGALVLPILAAAIAWPQRDRSRFLVPRLYAENAFRSMQPNALLLTGDWQLYAPMMYFQEAERMRPDVIAIEVGMLNRSWYIDQLARRHPDFMLAVKPQLDAYRPLLRDFEADPAGWNRDAAVRQKFYAVISDLIRAMIETHMARGPVYGSTDFVSGRESALRPMLASLGTKYALVPRGVVIEYAAGREVRDLGPIALDLRGLADGSVEYEDDDPAVTEVLPAYRTALAMRGRYLAFARKFDQAAEAYRAALSLDPENSTLQRELVSVEAMR